MALSDNIKARRRQLKLSQEYVADQLGISRQAVAKWESGKSAPSAANLAELAILLELTVSELVGAGAPAKGQEEQKEQKQEEQKKKEQQEKQERQRQRNAKMLFGRWCGISLINAGWDGYSSGLYSDVPVYWLAILCAGLALLLITSMDMNKKHKLEKLQAALGAFMIFSIFYLSRMIPLPHTGARYLCADLATAVCAVWLSLKYWRHIWPVKP